MLTNLKWSEKFRPTKLVDCIIPDRLYNIFSGILNDDFIPDMIFSGGPGVGKTTIAMTLVNELGCDLLKIPASLHGNIDTLRTEITDFVSTMSFSGKRKYVLLDESDYLNPNSTQPALRNFMDQYSKNAGFIFTCNYVHKMIEPLWSRSTIIDFNPTKNEKEKLAKAFLGRIIQILEEENIKFEKNVLIQLIVKYFPDWRQIINILQTYSIASKTIDNGILSVKTGENLDELVKILKSKKWQDIRVWSVQNFDRDSTVLMRRIYDRLFPLLTDESCAYLVVLLSKYMYQSAFVVDQEINICSFLTEVLVDIKFK